MESPHPAPSPQALPVGRGVLRAISQWQAKPGEKDECNCPKTNNLWRMECLWMPPEKFLKVNVQELSTMPMKLRFLITLPPNTSFPRMDRVVRCCLFGHKICLREKYFLVFWTNNLCLQRWICGNSLGLRTQLVDSVICHITKIFLSPHRFLVGRGQVRGYILNFPNLRAESPLPQA